MARALLRPRVANAHPQLKPAAPYGWPGRVVHAIADYSEAADAATLLTVLVGARNVLGAGPHAIVQADRHPMRENALLVGTTSKGCKGLSASTPREIFRRVDPTWRGNRAGLSSGQGSVIASATPGARRNR